VWKRVNEGGSISHLQTLKEVIPSVGEIYETELMIDLKPAIDRFSDLTRESYGKKSKTKLQSKASAKNILFSNNIITEELYKDPMSFQHGPGSQLQELDKWMAKESSDEMQNLMAALMEGAKKRFKKLFDKQSLIAREFFVNKIFPRGLKKEGISEKISRSCQRILIKRMKKYDDFELLDLSSLYIIEDNDLDVIIRKNSKQIRKLFLHGLKNITRIGNASSGGKKGLTNNKIHLSSLRRLDITGCDRLKSLEISFPPSCLIFGVRGFCLRYPNHMSLALYGGEGHESKSLDLSQLGLEKFPEDVDIISEIRSLDLSSNNITFIPSLIQKMSQLESLNLSRNKIETLVGSKIDTITTLKELDLSQNNFFDLISNVVSITSLRSLNIASTQVVIFRVGKRDFPLLEHLELSHNVQLNGFDVPRGSLPSLTSLSLCRQQNLSAIPDFIFYLSNLKELSLSRNPSLSIDDRISMLQQLRILHLRGNRIQSLALSIARLSGLQQLDLSFNHITDLNNDLSLLSSLTHLILKKNRLKIIRNNFSSLTSLQVLDLEENDIEIIEDNALKHLKQLQRFTLKSYSVTFMPPHLSNLTNLSVLLLEGTIISSIPNISLNSHLTVLNLCGNPLLDLPEEMFSLSSLTTLNVARTQISTVSPSISRLARLERLDLYHNKLEFIPTEMTLLPLLNKISLSGNHLMMLPDDICNLKNLRELDISCNPIPSLPHTLTTMRNLSIWVDECPFANQIDPDRSLLPSEFIRAFAMTL